MEIPHLWNENEYWATKSSIDFEFFESSKINSLIKYYIFLMDKLQQLREDQISFPLFEHQLPDFNSFIAKQNFSNNLKKHIFFILDVLKKKSKILDEIIASQQWQINNFKQKNYAEINQYHSETAKQMQMYSYHMTSDFLDVNMRSFFRGKFEEVMEFIRKDPHIIYNPMFLEYRRMDLKLKGFQALQKEVLSIVRTPRV